jgi:hypothetical protein
MKLVTLLGPRTKGRKHLKGRINELETNSNNTNIRIIVQGQR